MKVESGCAVEGPPMASSGTVRSLPDARKSRRVTRSSPTDMKAQTNVLALPVGPCAPAGQAVLRRRTARSHHDALDRTMLLFAS